MSSCTYVFSDGNSGNLRSQIAGVSVNSGCDYGMS